MIFNGKNEAKISKKWLNERLKYRTIIDRQKYTQYGYRLKALDELILNMYILTVFERKFEELAKKVVFQCSKKCPSF